VVLIFEENLQSQFKKGLEVFWVWFELGSFHFKTLQFSFDIFFQIQESPGSV
jgi:hypothetical protein